MSCVTFNSGERSVALLVQNIITAEYRGNGTLVLEYVNGNRAEFRNVTLKMFDKLRERMEEVR